MKNKTKNIIVTYGFNPESTLVGSEDNVYYEGNIPKGITFRVDEGGKSLPVVMEGVFGKNHIYSALAALACAHVVKWNILESIDMLRTHNTPPGRMKVLRGMNDSTIIDDTYNSSPVAAEGAVETLGKVNASGRKVAVLGDMLELGRHTDEAHKKLGELAKKNTDVLIVVGPRAKFIKEGAEGARMAKKNILEFNNSKEAAEFMSGFVGAGDLVLVKGSQGMRMERVTYALLEDKENATKLLVRQEEEWLGRN